MFKCESCNFKRMSEERMACTLYGPQHYVLRSVDSNKRDHSYIFEGHITLLVSWYARKNQGQYLILLCVCACVGFPSPPRALSAQCFYWHTSRISGPAPLYACRSARMLSESWSTALIWFHISLSPSVGWASRQTGNQETQRLVFINILGRGSAFNSTRQTILCDSGRHGISSLT